MAAVSVQRILEFHLQLRTPLAALKPVPFTRWLESSDSSSPYVVL